MKKVLLFFILTAFSSSTENVSINFEHKSFKSLIMLENIFILQCRTLVISLLLLHTI